MTSTESAERIAEPVGEVTSRYSSQGKFVSAQAFIAIDLPIGTKLYAAPTAETLTRAAEILEREAATLRTSHVAVIDGLEEWGDEEAHIDHDEMVRVARELREAGK